jgi:hypothetical protein
MSVITCHDHSIPIKSVIFNLSNIFKMGWDDTLTYRYKKTCLVLKKGTGLVKKSISLILRGHHQKGIQLVLYHQVRQALKTCHLLH